MRLPLTVLLGVSLVASIAYGRRMLMWFYEDLMTQSDLVAIALPLSSTDTDERIDLPGIRTRTPDGKEIGVPAIGIESDFEVLATSKGSKKIKRFTLHHYRLATPKWFQDRIEPDGRVVVSLGPGPKLVSFDPGARQAYFLFLVREKDGRYAPTSGQTDPGEYSVHMLQGREPTR